MKGFFKHSLCLLFLLCLLGCEEETIDPDLYGSLNGVVLDEASGQAMVGASISTTPATTSLLSDSQGKFDFGAVKTGNYSVRVEQSGYVLGVEAVLVEENKTTTVVVRLRANDQNNTPPAPPTYLNPSNGATGMGANVAFKWENASDPDAGDVVKYTLLLFASGNGSPDTVVQNTLDTVAAVANLQFGTEYFWQIVAQDELGEQTFGPVWHFQTQAAPDNRILFARKTNGKYDIWSTNPAGNTTTRLTSGGSNRWRPHFSPNRKKIAYLSDENLDAHLFVMNADGTDAAQITLLPVLGYNTLDIDFCWSPDGASLLYPNNNRLYRINADGTGLSVFATAPTGFTFTEVEWNGSAHTIAARVTGNFIFETQILLYNEIGAVVSTLVPDDPGGLCMGDFFPDGTRLLFSRDDLGFDSGDGRQLDARMKVKTIGNGNIADISLNKPGGSNDLDPRYSPDGASVIFVNTDNDGISPKSIWILKVGLNNTREKLIDNGEMPDWR